MLGLKKYVGLIPIVKRYLGSNLIYEAAPPEGRLFIITTTTAPGSGGSTILVNGNDASKPWYLPQANDVFEIAGGTYNSVSFSNMNTTSGRWKVMAKLGQSVTTQEFNVSGSQKNGDYDFRQGELNSLLLRMTGQRCFHLDKTGAGDYDNVHFYGIDYKAHSGYSGGGIFIDHSDGVNIAYNNGSGKVALNNVTFNRITFEAPSSYDRSFWYLARIGAEFTSGSDGKFNRGVGFNDVRLIGYMEVENAIHISNAEQAWISRVRADGINQNRLNPPHFRLLFIRGQGIIECCYFQNYSGNVGCIWGYNRTANNLPCIIRNCMGYNSRVYSVAEVQGFSGYNVSGVTKAPQYKLLNILADTLDTSRTYSGCAADVYNLQGGTLVVKNCVSINGHNAASGGAVTDSSIAVNNMSGISINHTTNRNRVYTNRAAAGVISGNYRLTSGSPLLNAGVTDTDLLTDFYGDLRGETPSIGAVQNIGEAPALVSIEVTPSSFEINEGQTQQLVATGTYDDDSKEVITSHVAWSSSASGVASVSSGGLVTGVTEGEATITATLGEVEGISAATINEAPVQTANWIMGINFCNSGSTQAGSNWNNVQWGNSGSFTNLEDLAGVSSSVAIGTVSGFSGSDNEPFPGTQPISAIYQSSWYGGNWERPGRVQLTGFNASKTYKIKVIAAIGEFLTAVNSVNTEGSAITPIAYPSSSDIDSETGYSMFTVTGSTSYDLYFFNKNEYTVILGAVIQEFD